MNAKYGRIDTNVLLNYIMNREDKSCSILL